MGKPNCYKCKHRGSLPGSAHSCCRHPATGQVMDDLVAQIMGILGGVGRVVPMQVDCGLNVRGNPAGVGRGWFIFPVSFDPVWLESCDGFESEEVQDGGA